MDELRAALPRFESLQREHAAAHQEKLGNEASISISDSVLAGQFRFKKLLWATLGVALILAMLSMFGTAWYARQQQIHRQEIADLYQVASTCLERDDFLCARDKFSTLIGREPNYLDAAYRLEEARLGLARQYMAEGLWAAGIDEIDVVLANSPDSPRAIALLEEAYDGWIDDELSKGNWVAAWGISLQRQARLSPNN